MSDCLSLIEYKKGKRGEKKVLPLRLQQLHHGNDAPVKVNLDLALLCFSQQHHRVCWPVIKYKKPCRDGGWGQGAHLDQLQY